MNDSIVIHWFRQDLRLTDNPSLMEVSKHNRCLPIYILDDQSAGPYAMGSASRWWLHHSLFSLKRSLGGQLSIYRGDPQKIFDEILSRFHVDAVYWNRCYEPWRVTRDKALKEYLQARGVSVYSRNGSLLWEPWTVKKEDGTPYKVFTSFYRKGVSSVEAPRKPLLRPQRLHCLSDAHSLSKIDDLDLLPEIPWDSKFLSPSCVGEQGAWDRLEEFIKTGLPFYKTGRDIPSKPYVSALSPHLHFGEISPNQIYHRVREIGNDENIDHFCSELGWREFSHSLLYFNPELPRKNLQSKFDHFPWQKNEELFRSWKRALTGVPMVDAGMRELWQTGSMHNRLRMIVGSFLVKNLRLHWSYGERWFWDTLLDADLANNSASWQWIAGCGADAAPYFRIFNPITQGLKFDPEGVYVRQYIPEIADLPTKYLFSPWEAPEAVLQKAQICLGKTYPYPVVDLKESRKLALEAFQSLKKTNQ